MIRVITFTDENMTISANKLAESAKHFDADDVAIYQPADLDAHFKATTLLPMLEGSRGYGWWVWKPYIILGHLMVACKPGDILIYSDAGQEIVQPLQPIIDSMDEDMMFFTNGFQHSHWCKLETATAINGEIEMPPYDSYKQIQASFIFFKVTQKVIDFVKEWYAYSIMPGMIDNVPRGTQFPEFAEHRHDQAILTCLQIKYGYKQHWFPSTTNLHQRTEEKYGVTILHHRKRNNEW